MYSYVHSNTATTKSWKQPKCPSQRNGQKRYGTYTYTMEYYSAMKKNEIVPFAGTWMDLQITIMSEVSQKDKDHMIAPMCGI